MDPRIWGPKFWTLLHIIMVKPIAPQSVYKRFFTYLQYLLPCGKCRKNYRYHLSQLPFPENQSQNAKWLIKIHNLVNKSLNKPQMQIKEALLFWENQHIKLDMKTIASYILETYDCYKSKRAHAYFWKHLPELLPSLTLTTTPPLTSKKAYKTWINNNLTDH